MKILTNGFVATVIRNANNVYSIKSDLNELLLRASLRGSTSKMVSNINYPGKDFRDYDHSKFENNFNTFATEQAIFGFYKTEPNVASYNSMYYCAIDGELKNKRFLISKFGLGDLTLSSAECIVKLYSIFKQSNPNDFVTALRRFFEILEGSFSLAIQDLVLEKEIVITNKYLFTFTNPNNYIVFSSELPSTFEARYAKLGINKAYCYGLKTCTLENVIALNVDRYKSNFILNKVAMYFDGSLESAVAIYVLKNILKSNDITISFSNKSLVTDTFIANISKDVNLKFNAFHEDRLDFIRECKTLDIDTYVDTINVDSLNRDFSEIYLYKDFVDIFTNGKVKYIPIFRYLNLVDIVKVGRYLEVPYEKLISCKTPIQINALGESIASISEDTEAAYHQLHNPDIFAHCGVCEICKRDYAAFWNAGIEDPYHNRYIDKIKIDTNPFVPYDLTYEKFNDEYRPKILSTIEI